MRLLGKGAHARTHVKFSPAVAMQTMHGIMQARLAASAKLSLAVASKTVPPPIAALGSKVQRCSGKQGVGRLRFIICHCVFYSASCGSK